MACLQVADHPAAGMGVDQQRRLRVRPLDAIGAQTKIAAGTVDADVLDPHVGRKVAGDQRQTLRGGAACVLDAVGQGGGERRLA